MDVLCQLKKTLKLEKTQSTDALSAILDSTSIRKEDVTLVLTLEIIVQSVTLKDVQHVTQQVTMRFQISSVFIKTAITVSTLTSVPRNALNVR